MEPWYTGNVPLWVKFLLETRFVVPLQVYSYNLVCTMMNALIIREVAAERYFPLCLSFVPSFASHNLSPLRMTLAIVLQCQRHRYNVLLPQSYQCSFSHFG